MLLGRLKVVVGAVVLALGVVWVTHDHAVAGSGAAVARTVVETAGSDEPEFKAQARRPSKLPLCPWWSPRCW